MEDSSINFNLNLLKENNEGKRNEENKILLKKEYKLENVRKKEKKKEKEKTKKKNKEEEEEEKKILLFENDEIVEYIPRYERNQNKHIVLDEDEYVNTLEKIIERNYFPDIAKYKSELFSEQKENADKEDARTRRRKRSEISSNDISSSIGYPFSDFMSESDGGKRKNRENNSYNTYNNDKNIISFCNENIICSPKKKKKYQLVLLPNGKEHKINLNMSLKEFQKKYTSEDNKSFDCLLNKMKTTDMENNKYAIEKRKKHNLLMEQIEECTKNGINCHMLHTNKADKEDLVMKFSSGIKVSDIVEVKRHKVYVNKSSTRFSKDENENIEKQIEGAEEVRHLRLKKKMMEDKTEQMIAQGKFHLLEGNNGFNYVRTPIIYAGKEVDSDCSIHKRERKHTHSSPSMSDDSRSENDEKNDYDKKSTSIIKKIMDTPTNTYAQEEKEEEEEEENHKNEFNLQKPSKRELVADRLQNNIKGLKYSKQALRKKHIKSVINKSFSSKMSTTSFNHSVLSKYSQKRLNELAQKSSLASQLLKNKRSRP